MKNIKFLIAAVLLSLLAFNFTAHAQFEYTAPADGVNLEGGVYHYLSGAPLRWVKVDLEDSFGVVQQTTYTNNSGKYYFHDYPASTQFIARPANSYTYSGSSYIFSAGLSAGTYCCGNFLVITAK